MSSYVMTKVIEPPEPPGLVCLFLPFLLLKIIISRSRDDVREE